MRQETERLSRLIENVLDFSRIQRGRKKYHFKLGDVNACVGDVVEMMTPCAAQAGFVLKRDFAEVPPFAFDADAVMQIVINLLDNAIKYARQAADKTIHIRTRCENGYALIQVEDRGPGIPRHPAQEDLRRVLPSRRRVKTRDHRHRPGPGAGEAIRTGSRRFCGSTGSATDRRHLQGCPRHKRRLTRRTRESCMRCNRAPSKNQTLVAQITPAKCIHQQNQCNRSLCGTLTSVCRARDCAAPRNPAAHRRPCSDRLSSCRQRLRFGV